MVVHSTEVLNGQKIQIVFVALLLTCLRLSVYILSLMPSAPDTPYDVLLNSPKLSLWFPYKQVGRVLFFLLDTLVCMIIYFILITKQLILC